MKNLLLSDNDYCVMLPYTVLRTEYGCVTQENLENPGFYSSGLFLLSLLVVSVSPRSRHRPLAAVFILPLQVEWGCRNSGVSSDVTIVLAVR